MNFKFEKKAEEVLNEVFNQLEAMNLDASLNEGVLLINANNGEYAINKHSISEKIWYSSPVSPLKYFILLDDNFVDQKNHNLQLQTALFNDLKK